MRRGGKAAKVEAKLSIARKTRSSRVRDLEKRLAEALEQQTATAEILNVISRSPIDIQPVLEAFSQTASRLCGAANVSLYRVEGNLIRKVAEQGPPLTALRVGETRPITRTSVSGRAIVDGTTIHVPDHQSPEAAHEYPDARRDTGIRTTIGIPLLREGVAIGAFTAYRTESRSFSEREIALLQTFADQAVIALENVRLFNETKQALEQQTATAEILRVISSSPTDFQPVLDAVAESATRLGRDVIIALVDEDVLRVLASHGMLARWWPDEGIPISRGSVVGRAVVDRQTVHIHDLASESDEEFPQGKVYQRLGGHRTNLAVPLLREGIAIGVIAMRRGEVRPFTDQQVGLLQTFADQAVIAIENVRLFKELEARNRELTEAVEQQTATAEILNVISRSPTNVQPVFEAILESAVRLCETAFGAIFRFDGERLHLVGHHGLPPEGVEAYRQAYPMAPKPEMHISRAIRERRVVYVPDILAEPQTTYTGSAQQAIGYRSLLYVPMLRDGQPVGVVGVGDREPGGLSNKHVTLVRTFADQAVIAIENVRLFNELESANRELAAASRHKSEFLANMSHELRTPLNAVIGFSEVLLQRMFGELNAKQDEYLQDIYASGQHLLSLINDILDLSKIEAGRLELEMTDFDCPTALDNTLTLIRERAGRRGIALHLNIDERLGQMRADERKIRQIVLNLLSNAIKFTPEGGRIDVAAVPRAEFVEVSVSDTGIGIAPEDQEAVFEEFRQVGTAAKKVEGTGLGLALSRKFIELHGGRIWVQSQVGIGSTFTFTIPVRRRE